MGTHIIKPEGEDNAHAYKIPIESVLIPEKKNVPFDNQREGHLESHDFALLVLHSPVEWSDTGTTLTLFFSKSTFVEFGA